MKIKKLNPDELKQCLLNFSYINKASYRESKKINELLGLYIFCELDSEECDIFNYVDIRHYSGSGFRFNCYISMNNSYGFEINIEIENKIPYMARYDDKTYVKNPKKDYELREKISKILLETLCKIDVCEEL